MDIALTKRSSYNETTNRKEHKFGYKPQRKRGEKNEEEKH